MIAKTRAASGRERISINTSTSISISISTSVSEARTNNGSSDNISIRHQACSCTLNRASTSLYLLFQPHKWNETVNLRRVRTNRQYNNKNKNRGGGACQTKERRFYYKCSVSSAPRNATSTYVVPSWYI